MSVRSRFTYQYRSFLRAWLSWRLPARFETNKVRGLLVFAIVFMGICFIVKTNELSTTGYHVHDLERQISALQNDTERLQTEIASLQSMPNINRRLQGMNMVQPTSVSYISNGTMAVAK